MLQSIMQLSKMVADRICSNEVSKPVSIKTKEFGNGSALAGARSPRVISMMKVRTIRISKILRLTPDKSGCSHDWPTVVHFGNL